jgi:hypothetical protein
VSRLANSIVNRLAQTPRRNLIQEGLNGVGLNSFANLAGGIGPTCNAVAGFFRQAGPPIGNALGAVSAQQIAGPQQ